MMCLFNLDGGGFVYFFYKESDKMRRKNGRVGPS